MHITLQPTLFHTTAGTDCTPVPSPCVGKQTTWAYHNRPTVCHFQTVKFCIPSAAFSYIWALSDKFIHVLDSVAQTPRWAKCQLFQYLIDILALTYSNAQREVCFYVSLVSLDEKKTLIASIPKYFNILNSLSNAYINISNWKWHCYNAIDPAYEFLCKHDSWYHYRTLRTKVGDNDI